MAEVTRNSADLNNAEGALFVVYGNVDIAANGDTWSHGLRSVVAYGSNTPAEITKITTDANGKAVFTTGGAVNDALVWAKGYA